MCVHIYHNFAVIGQIGPRLRTDWGLSLWNWLWFSVLFVWWGQYTPQPLVVTQVHTPTDWWAWFNSTPSPPPRMQLCQVLLMITLWAPPLKGTLCVFPASSQTCTQTWAVCTWSSGDATTTRSDTGTNIQSCLITLSSLKTSTRRTLGRVSTATSRWLGATIFRENILNQDQDDSLCLVSYEEWLEWREEKGGGRERRGRIQGRKERVTGIGDKA